MEWRHRSILGGALMAVHPRRWSETAGWRTRQAELRHSKAAGAFGGAAGGLALSPIRAAFLGGSRRVVKPTMKAMKTFTDARSDKGSIAPSHSVSSVLTSSISGFKAWRLNKKEGPDLCGVEAEYSTAPETAVTHMGDEKRLRYQTRHDWTVARCRKQ